MVTSLPEWNEQWQDQVLLMLGVHLWVQWLSVIADGISSFFCGATTRVTSCTEERCYFMTWHRIPIYHHLLFRNQFRWTLLISTSCWIRLGFWIKVISILILLVQRMVEIHQLHSLASWALQLYFCNGDVYWLPFWRNHLARPNVITSSDVMDGIGDITSRPSLGAVMAFPLPLHIIVCYLHCKPKTPVFLPYTRKWTESKVEIRRFEECKGGLREILFIV